MSRDLFRSAARSLSPSAGIRATGRLNTHLIKRQKEEKEGKEWEVVRMIHDGLKKLERWSQTSEIFGGIRSPGELVEKFKSSLVKSETIVDKKERLKNKALMIRFVSSWLIKFSPIFLSLVQKSFNMEPLGSKLILEYNAWIRFEREHGTLDDYDLAVKKLLQSKQYCGICKKIWHHTDGGNWSSATVMPPRHALDSLYEALPNRIISELRPEMRWLQCDAPCINCVKLKQAGQSAGDNIVDVTGKVGSVAKNRWYAFQEARQRRLPPGETVQERFISAAATTRVLLREGISEMKEKVAVGKVKVEEAAKKTADKSKTILNNIERWQKGVASTDGEFNQNACVCVSLSLRQLYLLNVHMTLPILS
ncbi:hypothetical protein ABZP36_014622 [Zizania latifolia]